MLLAGGAQKGARDRTGNTAMHVAAEQPPSERSVVCVRLLWEQGVDLHERNPQGNTPLHIAIREDCREGVALLIELGADVNATTSPKTAEAAGLPSGDSSDTPLLLAIRHGRTECVRMLLDVGADWGARDSGGNTALHLAVCAHVTECVRLLLGAGVACSKDAVNDDGRTPLHYAAKQHPECLWELKVSGFDIDAPDFGGYTPLHLAAQAGNQQSVELLKVWGADRDAKTFEGLKPSDLAANGKIKKLLGLTMAQQRASLPATLGVCA